MDNLRKRNGTEILNKMKAHSSRIEQTEDRISELEDEILIKGKTEDYWLNNSRPVKRIGKNSLTPSKEQTSESWALKKKRCKQKE
jgi:hypothetical protein